MTSKDEVQVSSLTAKTATGNSGPVDVSQADQLRIYLRITAVSGTTPTLVVTVEDSPDGTNYYPVASFASKNAVGSDVLNITGPFSDNLRITWTIGGTTPSFTFEVWMLRLWSS